MARLSLEKVGQNTYFFPAPTNIGLYIHNQHAILIDSGNDKEAGRQIYNTLSENNWELAMIINTHSNADHIGGNKYLQKKTSCNIATTKKEAPFIENPMLEPTLLYGGYPFTQLLNKFLMASPSEVTDIIDNNGNIVDTPLTAVSLPGHFLDMIGVLTPDDVFFLADSVFSNQIINKYHLFYLFDIEAQCKTLNYLQRQNHALFIPSHGKPTKTINELVTINKKKIYEICQVILDVCTEPLITEVIFHKITAYYELTTNHNQFVLLSSVIRSYISFLYNQDLLKFDTTHNKNTWMRTSKIFSFSI